MYIHKILLLCVHIYVMLCDNGLTSGEPVIVTAQPLPIVLSTLPTSSPERGFSNPNFLPSLILALLWTSSTICCDQRQSLAMKTAMT